MDLSIPQKLGTISPLNLCWPKPLDLSKASSNKKQIEQIHGELSKEQTHQPPPDPIHDLLNDPQSQKIISIISENEQFQMVIDSILSQPNYGPEEKPTTKIIKNSTVLSSKNEGDINEEPGSFNQRNLRRPKKQIYYNENLEVSVNLENLSEKQISEIKDSLLSRNRKCKCKQKICTCWTKNIKNKNKNPTASSKPQEKCFHSKLLNSWYGKNNSIKRVTSSKPNVKVNVKLLENKRRSKPPILYRFDEHPSIISTNIKEKQNLNSLQKRRNSVVDHTDRTWNLKIAECKRPKKQSLPVAKSLGPSKQMDNISKKLQINHSVESKLKSSNEEPLSCATKNIKTVEPILESNVFILFPPPNLQNNINFFSFPEQNFVFAQYIQLLFGNPCLKYFDNYECFNWNCNKSHSLPESDLLINTIRKWPLHCLQLVYRFFVVRYSLAFKTYFHIFCNEFGRRKCFNDLNLLLCDIIQSSDQSNYIFFKYIYQNYKNLRPDRAIKYIIDEVLLRSYNPNALNVIVDIIVEEDLLESCIFDLLKMRRQFGYELSSTNANKLIKKAKQLNNVDFAQIVIDIISFLI